MSFDDDLDELERRMELDRKRLPIEEAAREAQASGDLANAARLWRESLALAERGDGVSRWYVEGQLADVLLKSGDVTAAKDVLEQSIQSGSDIPFAHSLLVDIYMGERAFEAAFRVHHSSWRSISERARRNGMPSIDPSPQIIAFAKWWKDTKSEKPIDLAEKWADETKARDALFAVQHERARFLEEQGAEAAALELYLSLVQQGSKVDSTFTRAMILLDRTKRSDEALALARSIPGRGLSAALEEKARKRVARLEAKLAKPKGRTSRGEKAPKAIVPAFSIRSGASSLRWVSQVEIKGGIQSIIAAPGGLYATGGTEQALWWIEQDSVAPVRLRSIPKRTTFLRLSHGPALITDEGTVKDGRAHVEILGPDLAPVATAELPGITSEVAPTTWGVALGCRAGGLYAIDSTGVLRWRFDLPDEADAPSYSRPCPYFVGSAASDGSVVFSSFANVYALTSQAQVLWRWRLPSQEQSIGGMLVLSMPTSVSAIRATRDGGAWLASQDGRIFRVDNRGKTTWSGHIGHNVSQLLLDKDDRLAAVSHAKGIAFVEGDAGSRLTTAVQSQHWLRVLRGDDGRTYLATKDKTLSVFDEAGRVRAAIEFSRKITDVIITDRRVAIAAGKLVVFELLEAYQG